MFAVWLKGAAMDYQDGRLSIAIFFALICSSASGADNPNFSLPVQCSDQVPCFLQNMVDVDEGPGRQDPYCASATFNGHTGTDVRVLDFKALKKGIPALAMASGTVTATRDGVNDRLVRTKEDINRVKGRKCGNGVIIDHDNINGANWETQTCHLAKGSIKVKKGDQVRKGQVLALMGLSGKTQFPHVHVTVRRNGQIIDPVTGLNSGESCKKQPRFSLFSASAATQLTRMQTHFLQSGFTNKPVQGIDILQNKVSRPTLNGPLIFFAKLINLRRGDKLRLKIMGPKGVFATNETKPLKKDQATFTVFTGKRGKIASGTYSGSIDLIRDGKVISAPHINQIDF